MDVAIKLTIVNFALLDVILNILLHTVPNFLSRCGNGTSFDVCFSVMCSIFVVKIPFFTTVSCLGSGSTLPTILPLKATGGAPIFFLLIFSKLVTYVTNDCTSDVFKDVFRGLFNVRFAVTRSNVGLAATSIVLPCVMGATILPTLVRRFTVHNMIVRSLHGCNS